MTITIKGTTYRVEQRETAADKRAKGYATVADLMESRGMAASLIVQRPNGRVAFQVWEHEDGRLGEPVRLG